MSLLPVAEAQTRLLAMATPVAVERLELDRAVGRWLAEALVARRTQPVDDLSAMDGYAVRGSETGPWRLVGESRAGAPFAAAVGPRETARISTGAALPEGCDAVLVQEDAERDGKTIRLTGDAPVAGRWIRRCAEDFGEGTVLAEAGAALTPALVGLAALSGNSELTCRRRVRVALIATGDEIAAGILPDAITPMLAAMLAALPVEVLMKVAVPDAADVLATVLREAADAADLVLSSGGVSVGDHDLVAPAWRAIGGTIDFWRIAMRPGRPLMAGRRGGALLLGLPGNPVSALVTALLFGLPLVRALAGANEPLPREREVVLAAPVGANGDRQTYLRARSEDAGVRVLEQQDSAAMAAVAGADCLVVRAPGAPEARSGSRVRAIDLAV